MIQTKRAYEPPEAGDGKRFLVDRLWPRGTRKENLRLDGWLKEIAPSDALRKWFNHDPAKWKEFQRRYFAELKHSGAWKPLAESAKKSKVTLLFGAKDVEHNNAVALKTFLQKIKD
jgi:uncharacterized protein YeaO (DUF488 family)